MRLESFRRHCRRFEGLRFTVERSNWCEKGESVHDHELAMVNPVGTIFLTQSNIFRKRVAHLYQDNATIHCHHDESTKQNLISPY